MNCWYKHPYNIQEWWQKIIQPIKIFRKRSVGEGQKILILEWCSIMGVIFLGEGRGDGGKGGQEISRKNEVSQQY